MERNRTVAALCAVTLPVLAAAGCGSTKSGYADQAMNQKLPAAITSETTAEAPATPKKTGKTGTPPAVSSDLSKKPTIPKPKDDPPTKLVSKDIVTGSGKAAKSGDAVTVRYVGVAWSTGKEFDASWTRKPNAFDFTLGQGNVIKGWDQGVAGMKVGGRRELVIPPGLGYGAAGSGPNIGPNETLVFVIDMMKIA